MAAVTGRCENTLACSCRISRAVSGEDTTKTLAKPMGRWKKPP
jgi:hypothetical protein